jgi:hypothetical protein
MPLDSANWPAVEVDETTALLIRARGYLERGWCRDAVARDAEGNNLVYARSDKAAAWCMFGALRAAGMTGDFHHPAFVRLTEVLDAGMSISSFNDAQENVEPVLAAFDRAIAAEAPDAA